MLQASGAVGHFQPLGWFQLEWPDSCRRVHITVKELLPVVLGAALWGSQWQGTNVRCRCDNVAVMAILNSGTSRDELAMHLMRSLFFFLERAGRYIVKM